MSPKISIVVPVHNVEPYLEECLESIAGQTLQDLEVIMVDDGSTDNSAVIAKAHAARDRRFTLVEQANAGLGPARNTGVRHATGEYLAFADSDDVVPPAAYEMMVGSLEDSGSDFACGNVRRLEADGRTTQSALHRKVFAAARGTHVTGNPLLLRDRTAWNKVFRRSFWDAHGFEFPAGWYEDSPVTIRAHVVAAAVDLVDGVVYHWRRRPDSISEGRADADNVAQRLRVMAGVRRMLAQRAPQLLVPFDQHALLDIDIRILLAALPAIAEVQQPPLIDLGAELVSAIEPRALARRPAGERMLLRLLALRMLPELREVLRDRLLGGGFKAVRRGSRWHADYPFLREPCDITEEIKPVARVDRAYWMGDLLQVEGHAYLSGLYAAAPEDLEVRLWLRPGGLAGKLSRVSPLFARLLGVSVTGERLRRSDLAHEGSAFTAAIDPAALRRQGRRRGGAWKLCVEMSAPGIRRRRVIGSTPAVMHNPPGERRVARGVVVRPRARRESLVVELIVGSPAPEAPHGTDWRSVIEEELLCTGLDPCLERDELRRSRAWLTGRAASPAGAAAKAGMATTAGMARTAGPAGAGAGTAVPEQRRQVDAERVAGGRA